MKLMSGWTVSNFLFSGFVSLIGAAGHFWIMQIQQKKYFHNSICFSFLCTLKWRWDLPASTITVFSTSRVFGWKTKVLMLVTGNPANVKTSWGK